jgi:3-hydroxyisobutyrate dehydrogenase
MNVAILGTGLLGEAIGKRLLSRAHDLIVWNRTREKTAQLVQEGAAVADSPGDAVSHAEIVLTVLKDGPVTEEVLFERAAHELAGRSVLQMGTIAPQESVRLAHQAEKLGADYLEAPVLGSSPEALEGKLLIMSAGPEELYGRLESLLHDLGTRVSHLGEVGKAASLKLALNQLLVAEVAAFALSLAMVREAEVPVEVFMDIIGRSSIQSPQFEKKLPRMVQRDFRDPHFPVSHMLKDIDLVLDEAERHELGTEGLLGIRSVVKRTLDEGFTDVDYSALYNAIHPLESRGNVTIDSGNREE